MRRVLIYAVVYGSIGALIGVCVALYTADVEVAPKTFSLNGSATKSDKSHSSSVNKVVVEEVAEPSPSPTTEES